MPEARPPLDWAGGSGTALAVFAVILCCAVLAFRISEPYPLSHAHWDSAVYLLEGKHYADSDYLPRLRARASAVHAEVMHDLLPREYSLFTRLGHVMIIGEAVEALGAKASVGTIVGLYRVLFGLGLLATVVLAVSLVRLLAPDAPVLPVQVGAGISLILYLLSDIASYMSGNLVSEVPALLLLGLSTWTLAVAWARHSSWLAVISGCLGFLLYVVRMEGVWLYVSFLVAFGAIVGWPARNLTTILMASAVSLLLFLAYSWMFFPLTDPRLFVAATETGVKILGTGSGTGSQVIAANGLLWIGAAAALPLAWSSKATRLGVVWLILGMLPIVVAVSASYATQTRMFTMLTPALMLLSTMGWSVLVMRAQQGRSRFPLAALLIVALIGVMISQPATYSRLRALPGMWRLQYIGEFLASKRFERIDYHLPELTEISRAIAQLPTPSALIVSPKLQAADHIMIIQYLGSFGDKAWTGASAASRQATASEPVELYLSASPNKDLSYGELRSRDRSIFLLGSIEEKDWVNEFAGLGELKDVYATPNFRLTRIVRSDLAMMR